MADMPSRPDPLIDVKGAAEILRVHQNTVLKMLRAGALPGLRLGRYWRLRSVDLEAWLARQTRLQSESTAYPELLSSRDESD